MEKRMSLSKMAVRSGTVDAESPLEPKTIPEPEEDPIGTLCAYVVKTRYEDLPPEVVEWTKKSIMDTIACIVAGSSAQGCKEVVDVVKAWGGRKESTIPIYGGKVPAPLAAFAIGPMARAHELGDVHEEAGHCAEYVLPSLLAASGLRGKISGKELMAAHVLGCEVLCRIGVACHAISYGTKYGVYSPYRVWGGTVAVGKILQLDKNTLWNAIGLSIPSDPTLQPLRDGALLIRVEHGFTCDQSLKAVILAKQGITGTRNILRGEAGGFFNVFYSIGEPRPNPELVLAGLGDTFESTKSSLKPYPSCKFTHASISAAIDLIRENRIEPSVVEGVSCWMAVPTYKEVCYPQDLRWNPQTSVDCQFSMPYTVATGIITGDVSLLDFGKEAIWRRDIRELMKKVQAYPDEEIPGLGARVSIKTREGKEFTKQVVYVKGNPKNPMSMDEVITKFRSCMELSARPLPRRNRDQLVKRLTHLEEVDDMNRVIELLTPPDSQKSRRAKN